MIPETRLPATASALAATTGPRGIEVTWTNPTRRIDGSRIADLAVARLYRHQDTGAGEAKPAIRSGDQVVGYSLLGAVDLLQPAGRPPEAAVTGDRVRWVDERDLVNGNRYTYVVTVSDSTGRTSGPSARLSAIYLTPPAPPDQLEGKAGERQATLTWRPPSALSDGSPLAGTIAYEVLRASSPDAALAPLAGPLLSEPSFTDTGLENDRGYAYAVRAVRSDAGGASHGAPSATVTVTPRDVTPPARPVGLVAVPSPGAVRLSWAASPEGDVAAYIVYRQGAAGPPVRVGQVAAPGTTFTDHDLAPGQYRYHVTAVESGALANESAPSDAVIVGVP